MKSCFIFIAFVSLLCSCKGSHSVDDTNVLVKVKDRTLFRSDIESVIPRGISSTDSLLFAENLVKKWVKDALVYDVALRNLGEEKTEIDKLVEEYRHSLIRYRYQEKLVKERLSVNIRESEKLNYYEENQKKFVLDKSLIKGLFLKVPADAPGLSEVKKWYRSNSESSLERIEKYSIQNALIYEYFYDRWVDFDDVMDNIPMHVSNANSFLKANKYVEFADSAYCYLLNIQEYILSGSVAPYDYAESQIVDMLLNQKKVDFLRDFENDLYNNAIRRGEVLFNSADPH
ncbi:MAG: peptidyl-prolyl cis-trans isomerase [Tannerellaceae bacterium]|nr:peptidyl-prolyl cis-trans isomerase [Tannerellaceae bacterium]